MRADQPAARPPPDLFERLAAQQLGPAARTAPGSLRPWLPYSFDQPPTPDDDAPRVDAAGSARDASPDSAAWSGGEPPAARAEHDPAAPDEVADARTHARTPAPAVSVPGARERSTARTADSHATERPDRSPRVSLVPPPATPARTAHASTPLEAPRQRPVLAVAESRADRVHTHRHDIHVESRVTHERATHAPGVAPAVSQPSRLMPPPSVAPRRSAFSASPSGLQRNAPREPTIEIHIGRVEVRAQPGPPERPVAERASPSDARLAAYLHRRGTGARS